MDQSEFKTKSACVCGKCCSAVFAFFSISITNLKLYLTTVFILVVGRLMVFTLEAVSLLLKLRHLVKVVVVTILNIASYISFAKFQIEYAL